MAGVQGKKISVEQVDKVKYLLAETEMSAHEIARRMGTSKSTIITINRRSDIRRYNGKRAKWEKGSEAGRQTVTSQL